MGIAMQLLCSDCYRVTACLRKGGTLPIISIGSVVVQAGLGKAKMSLSHNVLISCRTNPPICAILIVSRKHVMCPTNHDI